MQRQLDEKTLVDGQIAPELVQAIGKITGVKRAMSLRF